MAKALELAEADAIKRLDELRTTLDSEATKAAAVVKAAHEKEVARLTGEMDQAHKKSREIDTNLKRKQKENKESVQKYERKIEGLHNEIQSARQVSIFDPVL